MKKIIIIIGLIIVAGSFCYLFYFRGASKNKADAVVNTGGISSEQEEIAPLEFTQEALKGYYAVYENPYVKYLRTALDEYSSNNIKTILDVAIEKRIDKSTIYGLDSFDRQYYKSRFIVFGINDNNEGGGKIINIIFQEIPDKVFVAWIYPLDDSIDSLEFRAFYQNPNFDADEMKKINIQYQKYLLDKEHSI